MPKFTLLILFLLPSFAEGQTLTRREKGDLAIQARAILNKHCSECHGDANNSSRLAVLDYTKVVSKTVPVSFVSLESKRSQILEFIESGAMPPANRTGPSDAEIDVLKKWVTEKAPDYPKAFDDHTTLATMLKDYEGLEEELKPHVRYLSFGHLVPADGAPEALGKAEQRLRFSLLKATPEGKRPSAPEPVDATATLFRLNIHEYSWDIVDLFEKVENKKSNKDVFPLVPFDLILLEYPDSFRVTGDLATRFDAFQKATKQYRAVPFLKADWLSEALGGKKQLPKATPLAEDLKSLVALGEAMAKRAKLTKPGEVAKIKIPDGPEFTTEKTRFTGANVSSIEPPLGAIYAGNAEPKPPPFELTAEAIDARASIESVVTEERFKVKINANRKASFHILSIWTDGTVDLVDVNGGTSLVANTARITTPKNDDPKVPLGFFVQSVITGLEDGYEHFVVLASEKETKPPVIVRSNHLERPIWRFLPDESEPVVRRVITLHVTKKP